MPGTVKIDDNNLVFEIHGVDVILAIRHTISVPLSHVASVTTDIVKWQPFQQLRVVGTSLPGVIKDGMFLSNEGLLFFEMHDPNKCITVSLKNEKFKKIIFEVHDKEHSAKDIQDAIDNR